MAEDNSTESEKSEGAEKSDTKSSRNILIIILAIAAAFIIMLLFAKYRGSKEEYETYYYNGFSFTRIGPLWYTEVQRDNELYAVPLHFGAREVENVSVHGIGGIEFLNAAEVYITFDPKADNMSYVALAAAEISQNLVKYFGRQPIAACLSSEDEACIDRPVINCTNTEKPVILLDAAGDAAVIINRNCITVKGGGIDIVRAADRFLLEYYEIM